MIGEMIMKELPKPKVVNLASATEYMAKIRKVKSIIHEKETVGVERIKQLQEEIKQVSEWIKAETAEDEAKIMYYETELLRYWNKQISNNPKFKLSTPYGKVKTRKQQPKFEYNEERLKNWLVTNKPDLIRKKTIEDIDKVGLRKFFEKDTEGNVIFTETGEITDILEIKEQPIKIEIEVK